MPKTCEVKLKTPPVVPMGVAWLPLFVTVTGSLLPISWPLIVNFLSVHDVLTLVPKPTYVLRESVVVAQD